MTGYLTAAELSASYYRERGWKRLDSVHEILADVEEYLASWGLSDSSLNRLDIAEHVLKLKADRQLPTPEQASFETSLREGTTAPSEAEFAAVINQMPLDEWERYRAQLGLTR